MAWSTVKLVLCVCVLPRSSEQLLRIVWEQTQVHISVWSRALTGTDPQVGVSRYQLSMMEFIERNRTKSSFQLLVYCDSHVGERDLKPMSCCEMRPTQRSISFHFFSEQFAVTQFITGWWRHHQWLLPSTAWTWTAGSAALILTHFPC